VLLIFDLVIGRSAALIAAGATLLVVIIIAVLPAVVRSNGQPAQSQDGPTKIS
jgi:hypothetical protein